MQIKNSQNATVIISRLKSMLNFKTDIELCHFLQIKSNTLSTWKSRNSLDYALILHTCNELDVDYNELFRGKKLRSKNKKGSSDKTDHVSEKLEELGEFIKSIQKEYETSRKEV